MPRSTKLSSAGFAKGVTGVDVLNAIRASMPVVYQSRIPQATQDNIKEFGNSISKIPVIQNSFVSILVNKIGMTVIKNKMYKNKLKEFQRGDLNFGQTIEEIYVDLIKAKVYEEEPSANNLADVYAINKPNIKVMYHVVNSQLVYPITIKRQDLIQSFYSVSYFEDFIAKIFEAVYSSEELDEFIQTKALIHNYMTAPEEDGVEPVNRFYNVHVDAIDDEVSAKAFARVLRSYSNKLEFMNNIYNYAGVTTHTPKADQVLFVNTDVDAFLDVEVLAYAFNMNKADVESVVGRKVVLDDFGDKSDTNTQAILVDRDWFMIYNQLYEMREQPNELHLYWQHFLHVWKAYSVSKFANAVRFTTESVDPTVVSVTVSPQNAEVPKGTSIQMEADVVVTNGASTKVTWAWNTGTTPTSAETKINATTGLVEVGTDETLETLVVKATSTADGSKTGTSTIKLTSSVITE